MKKFFSILITFLMAMSIIGCFGGSDDNDLTTSTRNSKYEIVGEIDMNVEYESYLGYSVEIKGKLKNTSKREFSYVSVTFAIYDQEGNQIETALDNMNYLQAGSIWSFTATMIGWTDEEPKSCKLVEINAW